MRNFFLFALPLLLVTPFCVLAQKIMVAHVKDAQTKQTVPFATIRFGNSGRGIVTSVDGTFELPADSKTGSIEVSSLGYESQTIDLPLHRSDIFLKPHGNSLNEVVVKPPYEKMRRILNKAIANKNDNNPDKYDWYRCHVYHKMLLDIGYPDSVMSDTAARNKKKQDFIKNQHLGLLETYSIRTWKSPQKLQEDVLATRISGLQKAMFTSMATDVLPFHAYTDYLTLNAKDYHNPVSRGYEQYYKFNLADELIQGTDTVWILSFVPKGHNKNELKGKVYINSDGYAISQLVAAANDTMLNLRVRIEQQYGQVPVTGDKKRWFPKSMNYIIEWKQQSKENTTIIMKGNSLIDSVTWEEDKHFRFDKTHTVRLAHNADERNEKLLDSLRPKQLDKKEARTYKVIDSLGSMVHADRYMSYMSRLPEGKIPAGIFDIDLMRLFSYNNYENVRLGAGLQTNEKLVKWLSLGGWAGYGFGDTHWKYGLFAEVYADKYKDFTIKAGYTDDINDPGHIHLNRDLDKNYLRSYLLNRVDNTKTYSVAVKKKVGYWSWELNAQQQEIIPKYAYALRNENADYTTFTAREASVGFRYAYAERTAPFFGYYYSLGSKYPIWYGKLTTGTLESGSMQTKYSQAVAAVSWHKHINRLGFEHLLVQGGKSWSDHTLPLSKLFAGNGFRYDTRNGGPSLYSFGGIMTMYPFGYYTDQFVSMVFRHDLDWKLYKLESRQSKASSAPNICLQYNVLYGTLANRAAQQYLDFSVPDDSYQEAGLLLNNLLRLRYANLYYLCMNAGYFYHLTPYEFDHKKNGRFVIGASIEF